MTAANNSWIVAYDKLSRVPPWLSDALCRLATGSGFAKRELYTDTDEVVLHVQRPIIMNGIDEMVTRGDLMDRALILMLPRITAADRKTERDFWRDFESDAPKILGTLLEGVSLALRNVERTTLSATPRMADFATWAAAAAPAFGWTAAQFEAAYQSSLAVAAETVLDASPIGRFLQAQAARGGFRGTASQLLDILQKTASPAESRHWGWPRSPLMLANAVRRVAPILERAGTAVDIGETRDGRNGDRIIRIRTIQEAQFDE